jgi:hypothetical protein
MQCIVTYATGMYSYLFKSVLRYNVLILDTYHPDTLYLREQRCENPWLFFEAKRGPRAEKLYYNRYIATSFELIPQCFSKLKNIRH